MPNSSPVHGLDKDLTEKRASHYDPQREIQARQWLESITNNFDPTQTFQEWLKNGVVLCKLVNIIMCDKKPIKYSESKFPFKQMENIHFFLERIKDLGVPSFESFQTVDLFEAKNMNQVNS